MQESTKRKFEIIISTITTIIAALGLLLSWLTFFQSKETESSQQEKIQINNKSGNILINQGNNNKNEIK